jgi:hypothetical protein
MAARPLLEVGPLQLDPAAHQVTYHGHPIELSAKEFALLHELARTPGRATSRDSLVERLYLWGSEIESNAIDVHIHYLRKKIAPHVITPYAAWAMSCRRTSNETAQYTPGRLVIAILGVDTTTWLVLAATSYFQTQHEVDEVLDAHLRSDRWITDRLGRGSEEEAVDEDSEHLSTTASLPTDDRLSNPRH